MLANTFQRDIKISNALVHFPDGRLVQMKYCLFKLYKSAHFFGSYNLPRLYALR